MTTKLHGNYMICVGGLRPVKASDYPAYQKHINDDMIMNALAAGALLRRLTDPLPKTHEHERMDRLHGRTDMRRRRS